MRTGPAFADPIATASLAAEVKSVNGRFLDVQFRLPEELRSVEPARRELIQARVGRGNGDVVEETEAHRPVPLRMMAWRPHQREGGRVRLAHHAFDRVHGGSGRQPRDLVRFR